MSSRELRQASIHVVEGHSLVVPLVIEGLPPTIECLGRRWQRKREFHLTALAERLLPSRDTGPEVWDAVVWVASGRVVGPVRVGAELRLVTHPERPELQTLIVMVACPGLAELIGELSAASSLELPVPPAHVTLYSTQPAQGIGIVDQAELAERAPPLDAEQQEDARRAMGWLSR